VANKFDVQNIVSKQYVIIMALQPFVGPWMGDQSITRPLPMRRKTQTE
jgi:hypothetical protein